MLLRRLAHRYHQEGRMSPQAQEVLAAIRDHLKTHGYSPTVRDIQRVLGYATPSAVTFQR